VMAITSRYIGRATLAAAGAAADIITEAAVVVPWPDRAGCLGA
jgi:hypothetical protein